MKYPAYSAYKASEISWVHGVPAHWELKRLKYIANRAEVKVEADEHNPLPYIGLEQVEPWTGRLIKLDDDLVPTGVSNRFMAGDTLFGKLRPYLAKACNVDFDGLCSSELLVLRGNAYDRKFLLYQLLSHGFINLVDSSTYGSKMPRASWDFIGICELPLPPLLEQETIARFLDAKTAQIDTLLAHKRQLIAKLKEKRQALIARTVTRGLPPAAAKAAGLEPNPVMKDSGVDWLGEVPRHWHVDRLKWSTKGCYNGVWGDEPNEIDDLICVRVADFDRDRFIVISSPPTIRAIETGQRRNRILQKNDLLIEKSGGGEKQLVGCVVQFTEDLPAVCSNFVARLPVASGCNARYLTYLHSTIYAARLNYPAIKQTTGIQNLDSSEYLNISVAYPPIPEQAAIAAYLDAQSAQIDTLLAKTEAAITRLAEYRQALITSAVTGKIDVRGWAQQHKAGGKAFGAPNNTIKTEAAQAGLVA